MQTSRAPIGLAVAWDVVHRGRPSTTPMLIPTDPSDAQIPNSPVTNVIGNLSNTHIIDNPGTSCVGSWAARELCVMQKSLTLKDTPVPRSRLPSSGSYTSQDKNDMTTAALPAASE